MKIRNSLFALVMALIFAIVSFAQSDLDKAPKPQQAKTTDKNATNEAQSKPISDADRQALRRESQSEEEAAILPYINNFFATTRLGPEDVISVDVFDQPNYSRANIIVPPNGRISYPLIGHINIAGRTIEELEAEFTEKLSEYIREPKVSIQIAQVHSLKFMVIGDVAQPGIYEMTRRMSVTEALAKAGYITRYGDLSKIAVLRMQKEGGTTAIPVNMKEVERGKAQDIFLIPGDTVVVPGNKFKTIDKVMTITTLGYWMRIIAR
ncbi:MAG: polysaccharide export protein [Acidobacteria bacterium]|nr:polysaccharide export protein [Acidobacteriota bacterium]